MHGRGTLRYALKVCWGLISQDIVDYKKDDLILAFQCLTQQAWWIYFSGGPQFGPPLLFVCEPSKFFKDEQFGVFEKFTCAYLFQIAREKSCDYVLIIYKKNFREETHAYHAIREKSRHQLRHSGRTLDLKAKDLIGHLWVSLIIDQSECLVCYLCLHWINSFLH